MGQDFLIPKVTSKSVDLGSASEVFTGAVDVQSLQNVASAMSAGLVKTAQALATDIVSGRTLPSSELILALKKPVNALSVLFVTVNSSSGSHINERLNTAKHMLAIMKGESGYNPAARNTAKVNYEGRIVISTTKGALQFTSATYDAALKKGASIISNDRILRPAFQAALYGASMAGWDYKYGHPDISKDPNQIIANVGWMAMLRANISKLWNFSEQGWRPKTANLKGTAQYELISDFGHLLKDRFTGEQLLFTYYHINGLGADSTSKIYHKDRLLSDLQEYKNIEGIPSFLAFVTSSIPELEIYSAAGVGDLTTPQLMENSDLGKRVINDAAKAMIAAGETPTATASKLKELVDSQVYDRVAKAQGLAEFAKTPYGYNKFLKEVYKFKFDYIPRLNSVITSDFDDPRKRSSGPQLHLGYDLPAVIGQPIFALDAGPCYVKSQPPGVGYGLYISQQGIVHDSTINYGHLSKVIVKNGEIVNKGDIIAFAGNTGHSSGPHLHVDIRDKVKNKQYRWPFRVSSPIEAINKRGT